MHQRFIQIQPNNLTYFCLQKLLESFYYIICDIELDNWQGSREGYHVQQENESIYSMLDALLFLY